MKSRVLQILEDLIRIESVNPHFDQQASGEGEIVRYIERFCREAGLSAARQPVFPGRDNVLIELKTGHPDRVLLFEAHMDTVSLGSMPDPLVPVMSGDRLYGRGACDTKASLAAMLSAFEYLVHQQDSLSCDLVLCASVDEEHAYRGLMAFLEFDLPISGAVVGEPTNLELVVAHKGCVRFAVETHGKAAHSSVPHQGDNAIKQMCKVIDYFSRIVEPKLSASVHPLCGSPTISVGIIQGGSQINIVPERCRIEVDRRIIPGEDPERVMEEIGNELQTNLSPLGVSLQTRELLLDWALNTPIDSEIVLSAQRAAEQLSLNCVPSGATYGSDASKLQALKGIPSIVLGPGSIHQAHSVEEWVSMKEVELAEKLYIRLAQQFGKRS
ncbi:hypothetical protein SD70_14055 [Gordoniibacillus kamchatkensis]|uniref:Peptidase M20 dimerisation domain-containing protein n=1 Tax=Gordoniibacillus kamchatkensis TaxID=1590651 RepID=A0ABR5AIF4_9BACL|nr:M20 family metallopeptidase [Paenibacillus sp. VKM B-2647]KIL40360.1 hypothetical protein SD70_14055 [Paenibacillus sp. VKM B-2647]